MDYNPLGNQYKPDSDGLSQCASYLMILLAYARASYVSHNIVLCQYFGSRGICFEYAPYRTQFFKSFSY